MRSSIRLFTLIALAGCASFATAQDLEGVVFVDDIETAARQQARGPQLPSLGRPSFTNNLQSVPREVLEQQPSRHQQASDSRGFSGPLGWLRGGNDEKSAPPQPQNQRYRDPAIVPATAHEPQRNQPPGRQLSQKSNQKNGSLAMRPTAQDSRVGLFGLFSSRSDATNTPPAASQTLSASGHQRGKPTATTTMARTAQPQSAKMPQPMPATSMASNLPKPTSDTNRPLTQPNPTVAIQQPAEPGDVVWADDVAPGNSAKLTEPVQTASAHVNRSMNSPVRASSQPLVNPYAINQPAAKPMLSSVSKPSPMQKPQVSKPTSPVAHGPSSLAKASSVNASEVRIVTNPVAPVADVQERPTPRAASLLVDANSMAQSAATEEEFSQIVQMCRHVLAIDATPVAIDYGKTLAAWSLNRRGELKADERRDCEALIDFDDAIRFDTKCWRAIHNRGVLKAQQGDFAGAFDDFNNTIHLNPKFAKAYSNRAALYVRAGDLAFALDDYKQAISLDPDLAIAHKGRGGVCHLLGQFDTAIQHYDAATLLAPTDVNIATNRADLLVDMGRYHQAVAGYKVAISLDANNAAAHRSLAWLLATCPSSDCRNAQLALASAERAQSLTDGDDDLTLDTLAAAKANAGDFAAAIELQRKAVAIASDDDRANYQSRLSLYEQQQPYRIEPASDVQQATYVESTDRR